MICFQHNYSTKHVIKKNLDEGQVGCGVFVDLQKALDTVDHKSLI